jgi:outer membrane protein
MQHVARSALLLIAISGCGLAAAQNVCQAPSPDCVIVGDWTFTLSVGAGGRTNPIEGNSDIPLVAIPRITYYGKRFFLENLDLGFTLHETDANMFNVLATPGYDRVFFHRNDLQNVFVPLEGPIGIGGADLKVPVPERHTTYLVGPEWMFHYRRFTGQLDALYEVTGEHDGYEVRAAFGVPLIESKSSLVASAGLTWKSAEVVRYYYGVEDIYVPGAALSPFLKLSYSRPLSPRWSFNAFAHYEYFGNAIADSPLVSDEGSVTAFAGFVFAVF